MGSGKTTAGRKLAAAFRWAFIDTDQMIEERHGMSVAEIFSGPGETVFRSTEKEILQAVSEKSRTVVSCGGGTPCNDENLKLMKSSGIIVYLRLSVKALASRLGHARTVRPLLAGRKERELEEYISGLLEKRSGWYEQADIIIDAVNTSFEEVTRLIADKIRDKGAFV